MATVAPRISVLMPVFNAENTLREAVASILAQTFSDFELIIVDDGSTDGSGAIAESLARSDSRIRIITQPNAGIVAALNRGIAEIAGSLVARMDSDDISLPQRFEKQVEYFQKNPQVALLGTFYTEIPSGKACRMPIGTEQVVAHLRDSGNAFVHSSVMMRTDIVRQLGGYRSVFAHCEDYDLWLRITEQYLADNLPEHLVEYRCHTASVSQKNLEQQFLSTLAARRCQALRRNGFADPALNAGRITMELLEDWGLRREMLCQLMIEWLDWNRGNLPSEEASKPAIDHINSIIEKYRRIRADYRLADMQSRRECCPSSALF